MTMDGDYMTLDSHMRDIAIGSKPRSLLSLPSEIRNHIWDCVAMVSDPSNLLHCCRQTRAEVCPGLLGLGRAGRLTIDLDPTCDANRWINFEVKWKLRHRLTGEFCLRRVLWAVRDMDSPILHGLYTNMVIPRTTVNIHAPNDHRYELSSMAVLWAKVQDVVKLLEKVLQRQGQQIETTLEINLMGGGRRQLPNGAVGTKPIFWRSRPKFECGLNGINPFHECWAYMVFPFSQLRTLASVSIEHVTETVEENRYRIDGLAAHERHVYHVPSRNDNSDGGDDHSLGSIAEELIDLAEGFEDFFNVMMLDERRQRFGRGLHGRHAEMLRGHVLRTIQSSRRNCFSVYTLLGRPTAMCYKDERYSEVLAPTQYEAIYTWAFRRVPHVLVDALSIFKQQVARSEQPHDESSPLSLRGGGLRTKMNAKARGGGRFGSLKNRHPKRGTKARKAGHRDTSRP